MTSCPGAQRHAPDRRPPNHARSVLQMKSIHAVANLTGYQDELEPLYPRGSIHTTIMELGPLGHNEDGLCRPNSLMVVYVAPLGI